MASGGSSMFSSGPSNSARCATWKRTERSTGALQSLSSLPGVSAGLGHPPPQTPVPLWGAAPRPSQQQPQRSWRANPSLSLPVWANNVFLIETCSAASFFLFQVSSASASKIRACVAGASFRKCKGFFSFFFCKISALWLWKRNHCGESISWNDDRSKIIFLCRKQGHLKTGLTSLFFVPGSVNSQALGPLILPRSWFLKMNIAENEALCLKGLFRKYLFPPQYVAVLW